MKRFYKLVSFKEERDGYTLLLDGKPVKTKSGKILVAPSEAIANEAVQEWVNQEDTIDPDTMPITQILNTKIDRVSAERDDMTCAILKYLDTDLLCYLTDQPKELAELQNKNWAQWRDWAENKFGHIIETTTDLKALSQPAELHQAIEKYVHDLDDNRFTILQIIVPLSGSLILGLAMVDGAVNAPEVFKACFVEEDFKDLLHDAEKYGTDPYTDKKRHSALRDLKASAIYLSAC